MARETKLLSDIAPHLQNQWLREKNLPMRFESVAAYSNKKAFWKCQVNENHIWDANIASRTKGSNCPFCRGLKVDDSNSLEKLNPNLASEWNHELNKGLTPKDVTIKSGKIVWWRCLKADDHVWKASVNDRSRFGCPYCSGRRADSTNSLLVKRKDLLEQWNYEKNGITPDQVKEQSNLKVWWICSNGHEWQAAIYSRTKGTGCPVCSGKVVSEMNSLEKNSLNALVFWDWNKNKGLTPDSVSIGSSKKIWMRCPVAEDHKWQTTGANLGRYGKCPFCVGQRVSNSNCLATIDPEIASEWHPTLNLPLLPTLVTPGTTKKVWWKCSQDDGHVWEARIDHRKLAGCPICSNRLITESNNIAITNPRLAKEWHYGLNSPLKPESFSVGSDRTVWWQCIRDKSHVWQSRIYARKRNGCPHCKLVQQSKVELGILFELKWIFPGINPKGHKLKSGKKLLAVDIYLPEQNLIIEYDGAFWHKSRSVQDLKKSVSITKLGYHLLRMREHPLEKILESDISIREEWSLKDKVDAVLEWILLTVSLEMETKYLVESYLASDTLMMTDQLELYVDSLLS